MISALVLSKKNLALFKIELITMKTHKTCTISQKDHKIKICIGYILKSADVGTLFSSRYSENSSHEHTRRHPHNFTHTCAHQCTPMHTRPYCAPLHIPTQTLACRRTHTYPRTPAHTRPHLRTPAVVVELIVVVVDEFELINHM